MPISFNAAEMLEILSGDPSDELKNRINEAQKYEASAGLRAKVKTTANDNAAKYVTDNLAELDIPDGVSEITMIYDFSTEAGHFTVRKNGVRYVMGSDLLAAPSAAMQQVVGKMAAMKPGDKQEIILDFVTKALGGKNIVAHVLATHLFSKNTKPALDNLYSIGNAEPLSDGISEIPEGDKLRVTMQYKSMAADKPAEWHTLVSCGKTASGGGGSSDGTRKKRTPPPAGFSNWRHFLESDQAAETLAVLKSVKDKHGEDYTKHVSPSNALRAAKHPVMMEADAQNPARM